MHPTRLPLYFYAMTKMPSLRRFLVLGLLAAANLARAQDPVTQFQMFGHFTANVELENDEQFSEFSTTSLSKARSHRASLYSVKPLSLLSLTTIMAVLTSG